MKIRVKKAKLESLKTEALAIFLFEGDKSSDKALTGLSKSLRNRVSEVFKAKDFSAELNETVLVYAPEFSAIKRILLVGLGKQKDFNLEKVRQVCGTAAKYLNGKKIKKAVLKINQIDQSAYDSHALGRGIAEGAILSLYKFTEFKTDTKKDKITLTDLSVLDTGTDTKKLQAGIDHGTLVSEGTTYARDLAMNPPNVLTPSKFAEEAKAFSKTNGMKCTVFNKAKLEKLGMNALLGVGQGSEQPPVLVIMEYKSDIKDAKTVAIVGKGMTFDTGGISLKPTKKMEDMKFDMCGAAAVFGTMKIVSKLKPPVNVIGVVASAENMPGGNAIKPSDVLKTYSGQTVEVINTDAEGRLILADALSYTARNLKPDAMIDLATLTGAVIMALGHYASGMLGNDRDLLDKVKEAGENSGEMVWELPIYPEFGEHLKSKTADMRNSNGPGAGTIYGACFLQKFVEKTPWVHLDIAGTSWNVKEKSYLPDGPTGVGVRLLSRMLMDWK